MAETCDVASSAASVTLAMASTLAVSRTVVSSDEARMVTSSCENWRAMRGEGMTPRGPE